MIAYISPKEFLLALGTLGYIVPFAVYFWSTGNSEFVAYVVVVGFFFGLIAATIRSTQFPLFILWGLSLWGLLHMAGGSIKVGDSVLYALQLIHIASIGDTMIVKYDQAVHFFGFFMTALVFHHLIKMRVGELAFKPFFLITAACASMGLGAVNEIVEFIPVLLLEETGVGGYYNTALDLVANGLGALTAVMLAYIVRTIMRQK